MPSIAKTLETLMEKAFKACDLDTTHAQASLSGRPELADYQCNGALALAKPLGKNPRELASAITDALKTLPETETILAEMTIAGPGFINLKLTDSFLTSHGADLLKSDKLALENTTQAETIIIDYGGPNMGKPMHVGHLRTAIIGESIKRMLRFKGHKVLGDPHLGDWGMPMGMIIDQIKHDQPDLPFFEEGKTDGFPTQSPLTIDEIGQTYKKATARGKADETARKNMRLAAAALQEQHPGYTALFECLRAVSLKAAKENFAKLNVDFDLWRGEYDVRDMLAPMVAELTQKSLAKKDQGAIIFPFAEETKLPPLILEKSDGGYTYGTTDLATVKQRTEEFGATKIIHVVDRRQAQHFEQFFTAARLADYDHGCVLIHAPNGTINGTDGKPLKSREGAPLSLENLLDSAVKKAQEKLPEAAEGMTQTQLEQLAQDIAVATIKFQDLHNNRNTDYIFDLEQFSRFEGKTGPYLQYSVARINSLFEKASLEDGNMFNISISQPAERELLMAIAQFSNSLERAIDRLEPSVLCEQVFTVAQKFSSFYEACPILHSQTTQAERQSRLALAELTRKHQKTCLDLLGIAAPEKMLKRPEEMAA